MPKFGPTTEGARRSADGVFAAFAFRFYNVHRDPKFEAARPRLGKYALIPSRLFSDTSIWTAVSSADSSRSLWLNACYCDNRYFFSSHTSVSLPDKVGDQRHHMRLRFRGENNYEWWTKVEHAIGPVRAEDFAAVTRAVFTAFEGQSGPAALADARAAFPRTGRHMAQFVGIDSVHTVVSPDGSTSARYSFVLRPDSLRLRYPAFAAYVSKYIIPTRFRVRLTDARGAVWLDASGRNGRISVRLRAKNGSLVTLDGPPRPLPDSLRIEMDVTTRFSIFRVGFSGMVGDFIIQRGERERGWQMRFQREPEWHLPLAVGRLIRTPLRRPFEGRGTELRLYIEDSPGRQTLSVREARTTVNESAIMRWLGGLGATAFGDFTGKSEEQENRFLREMFSALRGDAAALLGGE